MNRIHFKLLGRNLIGILASTILMTSCTKKFDELNTDRNAIATVGPTELPFLFAKAESVATINQGNYQVAQNLFSDQYAQYFACVATYFPSDRNVIRMDWVGAAFNPIYTEVVPQLQTIFSATESTSPEYALANIIWVLAFSKVTDYWGPIPYFNAGTPGTSVAYDPQDKIYDDFFKKLDSSIQVLKANSTAKAYGGTDLIYGGDAAKWLKFANTLRLRLAMRISAADPARAQTEAETAVVDGVMTTSPTDDAMIARSLKGGDGNGLSIMSDWNEFRMSASMESYLEGYQDPRLPVYFLPVGATAANPAGNGQYDGVRNGLDATQLTQSQNLAENNPHVGARWSSTAFGGVTTHLESSQNVMGAAEAYFLRAEGKLLGWNMGSEDAQQLYEGGITNSMAQWGIVEAGAVSAYIGSANLPTPPSDFLNSPAVSTTPIKWAGDLATQRAQIATQKWLALFPDGMEAWADFRRSRYLKLYPVVKSDNPDITNTTTQIIRRIPFLQNETVVNGPAVDAAKGLLGGEDKVTTPLWWDKN